MKPIISSTSENVFLGKDTTVYLGDALDVLKCKIPDNSIDLIFADPPYNIGKSFNGHLDRWPSDTAYAEWCYAWLELCIAKLKPQGSMYVMTSTQAMPYLDLFLRQKMSVLSRIVWHYDSSGVQARNYFGSMYEPILFCVKDKKNYTFNGDSIRVPAKTGSERKLIDYRKKTPTVYNSDKIPGNVWYFPRVRYRMDEYEEHPTQKPEVLLDRIVRASSNVGDTVLDPFSGTFTTCAVALKNERKAIGIELQEEYVKIALRRLGIQKTYNGTPLERPKKTFSQKGDEVQQDLFEEL